MHEVAATHNQYTFVSQRRQTLRQLVMKSRRLCFINTQLHNRNVGFRKNMTQDRPCPVIESPTFFVQTYRAGRQQLLHAPRQIRGYPEPGIQPDRVLEESRRSRESFAAEACRSLRLPENTNALKCRGLLSVEVSKRRYLPSLRCNRSYVWHSTGSRGQRKSPASESLINRNANC